MTAPPEPSDVALGPDAASSDLGFSLPPPARFSAAKLLLLTVVVAGGFGLAFFLAYAPRRAAERELAQSAASAARAAPRLAVVTPKLVSDGHLLRLPGSVQPLEEVTIYARANGYVKRWLADIGTHVEEGALLAEVDIPEVGQEIAQARASVAQSQASLLQAQANRGLAKTRLTRTGKLVDAGLAAQQELEQSEAQSTVGDADVGVAEATVMAQRANLTRLQDLQSFSKVTAPFSGTVTARMIERGSLLIAGNGTPLFRLASTATVRVFLQIPQSVAPGVSVGMPSAVRIREFPGTVFKGQVARTAGALDPTSRTLSTEIRVPNPDGKLLSGMYADVELTLTTPHRVFEIPSTALMSDANGLRVALVTPAGTLHLQPIVVERDLGPTIEVASGIEATDRVVQIASVDLNEGARVDVVH